MSLTKYEILLKAAECGSFTKAALKLEGSSSNSILGYNSWKLFRM